jgi:diguanylate cyclase (GGDEF)-like protein
MRERADKDRAFRRWAAAAGVLTALFGVFLQLHLGGATVTTAVDDTGEALAALAAAAACLRTAYRGDRAARWAWTLLGLAAAAWSAGELWWAYKEVVVGRDIPFPSIADAGFLAAVPLAAAAVLLWPGALRGVSDRVRTGLDGLVMAMAVLFVSWALVLGPLWRSTGDPTLATVIGLAYPAGDVLIVTIVLVVLVSADRRMWAPLVLVGAGLSCLAVSDSAFAYFTDKGVFQSGDLTGVGWFAGWVLVALAALHPAASEEATARQRADERGERLPSVVLPYVAMVLASAVLLGRLVTGASLTGFLAWNLTFLTGLVLARQFVAGVDNRRLADRLRDTLGELRGREDELQHQAFHDQLTGLANRALFWDRLGHAIDLAAREGRPVGVAYLDLDGFKAVNDRYGHLVGDVVLAAVAERLRGCVRPADTLARLGGDEFAVLVEGVDGRPPEELGQRLVDALTTPFTVGAETIDIGTSVGMAIGTWPAPDDAVVAADAAMYRAKAAGKGRVVVVDVALERSNATAATSSGRDLLGPRPPTAVGVQARSTD